MTLEPVPAAPDPGLNPAQLETLGLIREPRESRPTHRVELRSELRCLLEDGLRPLVERLEQPLVISKHQLAAVHGCEARFVDESHRPFEANAATVRGAVAHKAIELSVANLQGSPGKLVDVALSRLTASDEWCANWLRNSGEVDRAEVRALAVDRVAKFAESFPPLQRGWRPVPESRWAPELCDGRIVLKGKVDLTLGTPEGMQAAKVVIDFKTGSRSITHLEDLRFYALVETLRLGVPPWKVASYYLDAGAFNVEFVNEGMLEAAARRVVAGATKLVELVHEQRAPTRSGSPGCVWCPLLESCPDGQRAKAVWDEWHG